MTSRIRVLMMGEPVLMEEGIHSFLEAYEDIEVREVDADLDTPEFTRTVVKAVDDIMAT